MPKKKKSKKEAIKKLAKGMPMKDKRMQKQANRMMVSITRGKKMPKNMY